MAVMLCIDSKNMTFDFLKVGVGPRMAIWAHLPVFKWQLSAVWVSFCLDGSCTSLTNDLTPVSTPGNFSLGSSRMVSRVILG